MSTNDPASVLSFTVRPDGVARVVYDVPGEAVNTLRASFSAELERVFDAIAKGPATKAAILVSGKPDTWIAGADIEMIRGIRTSAAGEAMCRAGHRSILRVVDSPKPVVAAVHGAALGGGFEVALACHGRVLSDDPKTVFSLPEVQFGLLPGINGLERLAEKAGLQVALDHGLTGKTMRASRALALGVADEVVPAAILEDVAAELALRLAAAGAPFSRRAAKIRGKSFPEALTRAALEQNPLGRRLLFKKAREGVREKTGGHYPAPEKIVEVLEVWADKGERAAKEVEARGFGELVMTSASQRLIEIFFAQTALKKDRGVDEPGVSAREVKRVQVLGAGRRGAGVAYVTLAAGLPVRLQDRDGASAGRGRKQVADLLDEDVTRKKLTRLAREQRLGDLTLAADHSGLGSVDLVIEAVFEDLAVKQAVLAEVEAAGREDLIFASTTSSIPIGRIASGARRPGNVVGMHYLSPVQKMPLLEVIRAKETSAEVVATAVAVGKRQGKTVIVVNDGVGFYTSRILGPLMNEAAYLLLEGVPIEGIDGAMTAWGWPVGPIALLDEVGIDVAAQVGSSLLEAFGARLTPPPTMAKLILDDRKGRTNQRGFYLHGEAARKRGKGKHVDPSVYALLGLSVPDAKAKGPVPLEEIQMRCSLQLVNEALHCWGEGVLRSPRDGDVGAVFGLGFPPFRGGPFRYADGLGARELRKRIESYHQRFGARWAPAPALVEMAKSGGRFHG